MINLINRSICWCPHRPVNVHVHRVWFFLSLFGIFGICVLAHACHCFWLHAHGVPLHALFVPCLSREFSGFSCSVGDGVGMRRGKPGVRREPKEIIFCTSKRLEKPGLRTVLEAAQRGPKERPRTCSSWWLLMTGGGEGQKAGSLETKNACGYHKMLMLNDAIDGARLQDDRPLLVTHDFGPIIYDQMILAML